MREERAHAAGLTPSKLAAAAKRLEDLVSQPLNLMLPSQPWNQPWTGLQLYAIDKHTRHNPSYRCGPVDPDQRHPAALQNLQCSTQACSPHPDF